MVRITAADRKLVFLGGLHRSGTTLLAGCLTDHPEVSGFSNTGAEHDEGQFLQSVYPTARVYGGPGRFGFHPDARLTEESRIATAVNASQLWKEWSRLWDLNRPVLLEKSPPNLIRYRFLQAMFPGALFITIVRNPVAVALATQKWSRTSIGSLIKHWLRCHELWREDAHFLHHHYAFKYEDFVAAPQESLDSIFAFMGLDSIALQRKVINSNSKYYDEWEHYRSSWWSRRRVRHWTEQFQLGTSSFGYSLRDCEEVNPLGLSPPT